MARAPTRNSPIPANANGCSAVSHVSPDTPCAASASTSDAGGGQQRSSSAAQLDIASSRGNVGGAGVSVYFAAKVDTSSSAISNSDNPRAPTAMTPLSRPVATLPTNRFSPTITPTAIAPPSAPVVALELPPSPQDSVGSGDQIPAAGQGPVPAQDKPLDRVQPSQEVSGDQRVEIRAQGQGGRDRNRPGDQDRNRPGDQDRNRLGGQDRNRPANQDRNRQGDESQRKDRGRNGGQDQARRGGKDQNRQADGSPRKGKGVNGDQNQDRRGGKDQNRQVDENQRKGKGDGRKNEEPQRDNPAPNPDRDQRQGSSSIFESPPARSTDASSSVSSAEPEPSRTSTSRSTSFPSKSPYTSVEQATQSSDQARQTPPGPQKAQSEDNQNPSPPPSALPTSTSTTVERSSPSAPVPQKPQDSEKQNPPSPPNIPAAPETAQGQGPAPTNEALNPQVEATQSQDLAQVPSAPTFAEPAPPDSSAPTPSPAPRLNPEINLGLQDDPISQTSTVPNDAGSTASQDEVVRAPSTTQATVPVAIPIETPTSSEPPNPSAVLGDTGADSRIPPPNFIPLGGSPKSLGDSGGAPGTNPSPGKSSQASRGLPTGGIVGISVGGFAAIILIGVALWLWRKSVAKKRQGRSPWPFGESAHKMGKSREEKGSTSGAQTGIQKLVSSLGLFKGGKSRAAVARNPQANTNRGTALFWNVPKAPPISNGLTVKDRVVDWWTRKAEDIQADQGGSLDGGGSGQGGVVRAPSEYRPQLDLNLDRSGSLDPFSDNNASFYSAAHATQLPPVSPPNPFADPTQRSGLTDQRPPSTPSRAHGRSQSAVVRDSYYPSRSMAFRPDSGFRESLQSVTPFAERRNKCRSDPFDLEIESRLIPSADDIAQMPRLTGMSSTYSYHTRGASLPYSQYSSGVSLSDWSVMGADLGLATGPTMGEQGRPSEPAEWLGDTGGPQGEGGLGQAL